MMKKSNKKGFTLVELIVVIAIMAILAAVLVPVVTNKIKDANDSAKASDVSAILSDISYKIAEGKEYDPATYKNNKVKVTKNGTLAGNDLVYEIEVAFETEEKAKTVTGIPEATAGTYICTYTISSGTQAWGKKA